MNTNTLIQTATTDRQSLSEAKTWPDLVARFIAEQDCCHSSRALYTRTLSQFFHYLDEAGLLPIFWAGQLQRSDIVAYKDNLQQKGLSPLTIGSYLTIVRKFFAALEAHKIFPDITRGIKTPRKEKGFRKSHLTDAKSAALLDYARDNMSARDFAIINLMLRTGLRTIEVVRADIADLQFKADRRILSVWGKGHDRKDDFVILTAKAYEPIRAYLSERNTKGNNLPLFASESRRNAAERLTTRTISGICKQALRAIGLDDSQFTAHSLRHTTACAILKHGGQITDAQGVLRHNSPTTTQIYTASIEQELRLQNAAEGLLDEAF